MPSGLDGLVDHVASAPRVAELEVLPLVLADALACAAGSGRPFTPPVLGEPADSAIAMSIRDLDDIDWRTMHHPSSVIVPAVLCEASRVGCSGEVLTAALVAGYRAASGFGHWLGPDYRRNWHATSVCGALGSAAGAVTVAGGGVDQLARALATAATSIGGLAAAPLARNGAACMTRAISSTTGVMAGRGACGEAPAAMNVFSGLGGVQQALNASQAEIPADADVSGTSLRLFPVTGFGQAAVAAAIQVADDDRKPRTVTVRLSPAARAMSGTGWWDIGAAVQATLRTGDPFSCDLSGVESVTLSVVEDSALPPARAIVHVEWMDGSTTDIESDAPGRVDDPSTRQIWDRKAGTVMGVDPDKAIEMSRTLLQSGLRSTGTWNHVTEALSLT